MSLAGGLAVSAALLISRIAGERTTYNARYYLGAAAAAVMLIPIFPLSIPATQEELPQVQVSETDSVQQDISEAETADTETAVSTEDHSETQEAPETPAAQSMDSEYTQTNYESMRLEELFREFESSAFPIRASKSELYITLLALLWIFGMMAAAARYIIGAAWFKAKIFCFSHPAPQDKRLLLDELKSEFHIRRKIRLRVFMGDMSPFITGIIFNTVYIPQNSDEETLRLVLRHELIHCKRFDLLYKGLTELAAVVHFFNPFVYLLKRYVNKFCELSCDEQAIEGMSFEDRKRYTTAMLTIIKKSRYRLRGAAALGEKKSNLRERVEFIMKNRTYSRKCRITSRALVAAVLAMSMVLGLIAQAQNTAEMPQMSYADDDAFVRMDDTNDFEYNGSLYGMNLWCEPGPSVFSDVLGFTRFYASWSAESVSKLQEARDYLTQYGEDAFFEWEMNDYDTTDFYEVTLTSVVDRWSYITESIEGRARLSRNGEVIAEELPIYIENTPGSGNYKYMTHETTAYLPEVMIDGEILDIGINSRYHDLTNDDRIEYESVDYNFDRSRNTRIIYISEVAELTVEGLTYTNQQKEEVSIAYNPKSQNAEINLNVYDESAENADEYDNWTRLSLSKYRSASVTDNSITADFAITLPEENAKGSYERKPIIKQLTVTGLNGNTGDTIEISSNDGTVNGRLIIGAAPEETTRLKGTRDVSEFIVEGEDYFVGTPAEQADFDRDEHNKYYKRIVVDDEGKVIFVIPIELQQSAVLNEAVEKMHGGDRSYQTCMHYENLVYTLCDGVDTAIMIDSLTWWPKAILTSENCFVQPSE